jgi:hypothetical protein
MKKKLMICLFTIILMGTLLSSCHTTTGLRDRNTPIQEQSILYVDFKDFSSLHIDGTSIAYWSNSRSKDAIFIPAGEHTFEFRWEKIINEERVSQTTIKITYTSNGGRFTFDFKPGQKYSLAVERNEIKLTELGKGIQDSGVAVMWNGSPLYQVGWSYPNALGFSVGMQEGVEIVTSKTDTKIVAEGAAGMGFLISHPTGAEYLGTNSSEFLLPGMAFPLSAGLRIESFVTPGVSVFASGGIKTAYVAVNDSDYDEEVSGIFPIIPYVQAGINFHSHRWDGNTWPFAIYGEFYPIVPYDNLPKFGVGLRMFAW